MGGAGVGAGVGAGAARSRPDLPADLFEGMAVVAALAEPYAALGAAVRAASDTADEAGDADTADLFTGVSRGLDKSLWFLEAHLQSN